MTRHITRLAAAALSAVTLSMGVATVAAPAANAATAAQPAAKALTSTQAETSGARSRPDLSWPWEYVSTYTSAAACIAAGSLGPGWYIVWACEPVKWNNITDWELFVIYY